MLRFVTSNENKFREARDIMAAHGIEIGWIKEGYTEVQADTIEEVVRESLKIIPYEDVFIEDSGIFIRALGGFPGVYSAYVENTIKNPGILKLMEGVEDRRAEFVSVIGVSGEDKVFKGVVKGNIAHSIRGEGGFGYDPIFIPEGREKTFAEDPEYKSQVSHRRRALDEFVRYLSE
ncbi:MAG: XTP/dITP diphosphatase [Euryarchaeota archaeon]|nr:XTP/dITP diphosphatase [Euryarchaeota archaeon]